MSKTLKVMFSLVVALVLVLGLSTTAFAYETYDPSNPPSNNPSYNPSYGPNYTPGPTPVIYYPNYDQEPAQQEAPAAEAEPVPASPKTGDNGIVVLVLVGAAVVATLGYAGVKALRA